MIEQPVDTETTDTWGPALQKELDELNARLYDVLDLIERLVVVVDEDLTAQHNFSEWLFGKLNRTEWGVAIMGVAVSLIALGSFFR